MMQRPNLDHFYKTCPILQVYIPNANQFDEYIKIIFETSYKVLFRTIIDHESKYFFCTASKLKENYHNTCLFTIIINPYTRMFRHYKEYQKEYGSQLTFTKFIRNQLVKRTLFECNQYIDTDIDFIIKGENFQNDCIEFFKIIGLEDKIRLINYRPPSISVPRFYTTETTEIIKELFKTDLKLYYKDMIYNA